jgi:hypothetical protein
MISIVKKGADKSMKPVEKKLQWCLFFQGWSRTVGGALFLSYLYSFRIQIERGFILNSDHTKNIPRVLIYKELLLKKRVNCAFVFLQFVSSAEGSKNL